MKSNLLSVQHFCRDNFCSFYFDSHRFQIQDLLTGKPLYKGISKDGLYPIHGLSLPSWNSRLSSASNSSSAAFQPSSSASHVSYKACPPAVCSNVSATNLWHMRLGHPQSRVLHHILRHHVSDTFSVSHTFCKHCVMGKMTQLPFSTSTSCTQFLLQLVHSDVWGPAPIDSINGHRYYVIFVDDFTRFTWFFPLKHKSQVLASFQHFKNTMENHLGTSIKTLRTDCGGEYTNNEFRLFCSKSGILHQFTCPHTSQQNGVAERKHRHIVDMALTLISHSSLPFQYWTYAFSTAIFLINRLPSLSRGSISPWQTLFGNSPNFSFFKSFGCACFPLLRPYSKNKLNLRSKECVFLGYASSSKGYLCLDPVTSQI
jgi:transposase InsO family protein